MIPLRTRKAYEPTTYSKVERSRTTYDSIKIDNHERSRSTVEVRQESESQDLRSISATHSQNNFPVIPPTNPPSFSALLDSVTVDEDENADFTCKVLFLKFIFNSFLLNFNRSKILKVFTFVFLWVG